MITEFLFNEAIVGVLASTISSVVTWQLAKKRYNAEVDAEEIKNLKESLSFYKEVLEENQKLLKDYMRKVDEGMLEIHSLRKAVSELLAISCVDTLCKKRRMVEEQEARRFLSIE